MNTQFVRLRLMGTLAVAAVLLGGCLTPEPKETKAEDAQKLVDSMRYVKAKNGLCFGVATVDRISTNGTLAMNQMIVQVDCARVGL